MHQALHGRGQREGLRQVLPQATRELALLKKSIHSLTDLLEILLVCKQRHFAFLSSLDDLSAGERDLQRLRRPRVGRDPSVKGVNVFNAADQTLLRTLQRGEFNIHGWRRVDLFARLPISPSAMSRQLGRMNMLGLIKKVTHRCRCYLTRLGREADRVGRLHPCAALGRPTAIGLWPCSPRRWLDQCRGLEFRPDTPTTPQNASF